MTDVSTATRDPAADPAAWVAADLAEADWRLPLPAAALAELDAVAATLARSPLPTLALDPADFALAACRAFMARVRHQLDHGIRFALIDRLPVERWGREIATQLYWLLMSLLARPVAQKLNGTMLFDVKDGGRKLTPGSGVRPAVTNAEQWFHNDNAFNDAPPDYVALFCLQQAKAGGVSRMVSLATVHERLRRSDPAALARLYRPFWFDRQREHPADESPVHAMPVFADAGGLRTRLTPELMINGYAVKGEPLDDESRHAIDALRAVFGDPALSVELRLREGEIQLVNNLQIGHARSAFEDFDEPERKRHLVRLWLRERGRRTYQG